jgi:hypothetical protein
MALASLMRLSLEKAANVDVGWVRAVGDPGFAPNEQTTVHSILDLPTGKSATRDDKGEGGASIDSRYLGWTERLN